MKSNSCLCVHKYIYAIEEFLSVQTIHIFIELFNFYIFKQETFCAQGKKMSTQSELYCTQVQMMSIFQKENKRSVSTLRQEWINFYLNLVYRKAFPPL